MTQGPFKPVPIKAVRWEAQLDNVQPVIQGYARTAALKNCLADCSAVLKPNNMYFLEITDEVEEASEADRRPFDIYRVTIRIWEKPNGDNTSNTDQGK